MPDFTITVNDAMADRVRAVLGRVMNEDQSPASVEQVRQWIIQKFRREVAQQAHADARSAASKVMRDTLTDEGW